MLCMHTLDVSDTCLVDMSKQMSETCGWVVDLEEMHEFGDASKAMGMSCACSCSCWMIG